MSRPGWRAARGLRRWVTIVLLVTVNALVISASLVGRHWRPPSLADRASSLTAAARPAPSLALSRHYAGVAVQAPAAPSLSAFTRILGGPPGIVEYYMAFGKPFPAARAAGLARGKSLSLIQINPRHVSLAAIASGKYDSYLRGYAAAVRRFGAPVALSFGHEMNGWWYSWGPPRTSPATFVAAWRHIHAVFASEHAANAVWVWTVSRDANRRSWPSARAWWPGAGQVNWVAIDGYFRKPGQRFGYVFAQQLAIVRAFTSKPVLIGETAAGPGPDQGNQIRSLVAGVARRRLLGFVWFDINAEERWNIDDDAAAAAAFRAPAPGAALGRHASGHLAPAHAGY